MEKRKAKNLEDKKAGSVGIKSTLKDSKKATTNDKESIKAKEAKSEAQTSRDTTPQRKFYVNEKSDLDIEVELDDNSVVVKKINSDNRNSVTPSMGREVLEKKKEEKKTMESLTPEK